MMDRIALAVLALLSVLPALSTVAQAQEQPSSRPSASTFYIPKTETQFSVNIGNDSEAGDMYIYLTSPAYSWVGFGFGERMKDSLMFIVYPSENGKNITISPRIATGHSEPLVAPKISLETLPGTGITDEMFVVKAVCHYCRAWPNGFIDTKATAHPMIYAFGPGTRLQSNAIDAPLRRHRHYGRFTMDMVAATGKGEVPAPEQELRGAQEVGGMKKDRDRKSLAHAVLGCLALFLIWPINVLVASFFKGLKWHLGVSGLVMAMLIVSFGLGIAGSGQYQRTKDFRSPHQIFALISIFPLTLISILPARPIAALSSYIPRLHTPLISLSLSLLIITGGLGLHLSNQARPIILAYSAVALLVFFFCILVQTCVARRGSARARQRRRQLGEDTGDDDDAQRLVLKAYWTGKNSPSDGSSSRSGSAASGRFTPNTNSNHLNSNPYTYEQQQQGLGLALSPMGHGHGQARQQSNSVYAQGHTRSGSSNGSRTNIYGGGTMPGPQYLLNMHPGVPVHKW